MDGSFHVAGRVALPRPEMSSDDAEARKRRSRILRTALKIGFTVLALVLVARIVDPAALVDRARRTEPLFFAVAILLMVVQIPLVSLRWRRIVKTMSLERSRVPSVSQFHQITYIAQLFGQVLPFIAGDGLRVLFLREAGASLRVAFKSTLLDRGVAALVLFAIVVPGLMLSPIVAAAKPYVVPVVVLVVTALAGAAVALATAGVIARFGARWRVLGAITETILDLRTILLNRRYAWNVVGICLAIHAISIFVFWLLAKGQRLPFEITDAVAVVPLVLLVSMVPIAVGGWGVREGFVVALLGAAGVGAEDALLLSLSFGTVVLVAALPGVVVLALSTRASARRAGPAET